MYAKNLIFKSYSIQMIICFIRCEKSILFKNVKNCPKPKLNGKNNFVSLGSLV